MLLKSAVASAAALLLAIPVFAATAKDGGGTGSPPTLTLHGRSVTNTATSRQWSREDGGTRKLRSVVVEIVEDLPASGEVRQRPRSIVFDIIVEDVRDGAAPSGMGPAKRNDSIQLIEEVNEKGLTETQGQSTEGGRSR